MPVIETFWVQDVDGPQEYVVLGVQPEVTTSTLDRRPSAPGPIQYRFADGSGSLIAIDGETFEVERTGRRVRRLHQPTGH
jgi:hypothetical protein